MNVLVLDTETSSLSPNKGQIIEIAGVILDVDTQNLTATYKDSFSSLVYLEEEFDPKITRLTTITHQELLVSPHRSTVQQEWRDFITRYQPQACIGHSIGFDTEFLYAEEWYLPPQITIIDTLESAKILYPHLRAVNLEYIAKALDLTNKKSAVFTQSSASTLHRALYDTELCALFFINILQTLAQLAPLSQPLLEVYLKHVFALPLIVFAPDIGPTRQLPSPASLEMGWFGEQHSSSSYNTYIHTLLAQHELSHLLKKISILLEKELPHTLLVIILSIASSLIYKSKNPQFHVYLHLYGEESYEASKLILHYLHGQKFSYTYQLPLEQFVQGIQHIFSTHITFTKIDALITLGCQLAGSAELLENWQRNYTFVLFYANQLAIQGSIPLQSHEPRFSILSQKIQDLTQLALHIQQTTSQKPHPLLPPLHSLLLQHIKLLQLIKWGNGSIESMLVKEDQLVIVVKHQPAEVSEAINALKIQQTTLTTFATPATARTTLTLLGYKSLVSFVEYKAKRSDSAAISLSSLTDSLAQLKNTKSLVLISQSKLIERIQNILLENWENREYLLYGEHGGITKILSKLEMEYHCPTFLRMKDWNSLTKTKVIENFESIILVGLPYIAFPRALFEQWGSEWEKNSLFVRKLLLESIAGQAQTIQPFSVIYWNV